MEALHHIECKLQRLSIALCPSASLKPLDDVLKQYMDTLCSNGNVSTQVEDWLVDIETTANLLAESRTKLAQA